MATSDAIPNHKAPSPLVTRGFQDLLKQWQLFLILVLFSLCIYCCYDARSPCDRQDGKKDVQGKALQ